VARRGLFPRLSAGRGLFGVGPRFVVGAGGGASGVEVKERQRPAPAAAPPCGRTTGL